MPTKVTGRLSFTLTRDEPCDAHAGSDDYNGRAVFCGRSVTLRPCLVYLGCSMKMFKGDMIPKGVSVIIHYKLF